MKKLLHILARLKRLQWYDIRRLMVLCATVFVLSASLTMLDIGSTSVVLEKYGVAGLGFDYLLVALGLIIAGRIVLKMERRRGYGAAFNTFVMTCLWGILLFVLNRADRQVLDIIFAAKYSTIFLLNVAFWALAERFIKLSMRSLKFLGVFLFEAVGVVMGAWFAKSGDATMLLQLACVGMLITTALFKILGWFASVPKETFIQKIGGAQDLSERIIVDVILAISFCWTFMHALTEVQVYTHIVHTNASVVDVLSNIYLAFGFVTIGAAVLLAQTRFLYTMQLGLVACAVSAGLCALGSLLSIGGLVYGSAVIFLVTSHFYISRYLSLLPRPLAVGKGMRLKKMRWLIMRPCAFVLLGALLLTVSEDTIEWILMGGMIVLASLFWLSLHLYGRQLVKMCALRIWRGGPLMLAYQPLKQMVRQGLSKPNAAEVIYFLNIVNEGYTRKYRKILLQMLNHPAISVRLFVLKKLQKMGLNLREKRQISELMKSDPCEEVQNMALALLITDALESNGNMAWQKYKSYLDEKKWIWGACMGFLSGRGAWRGKVIEEVIKLANSHKTKDNLIALSVMGAHPRSEWTESVGQLLNKTDTSIMKAAITVAGELKALALLNRLLPMLDEIRWRDHVLETLSQYGKTAFPTIEKMILSDSVPLDRQKELILFLGRLPSGEGKQILLRALFSAKRVLRSAIIESLGDSEIVWVHENRKKVLKKSIENAISEWHEITEMLVQVANLENENLVEAKELFQEALHEELNRTRWLILDQIALYVNAPLALKAIEILKENDLNAYAGAVSCLQDLLDKKLYKNLRSILLYPTINEPPTALTPMGVEVFLNRFVLNPFSWTNPWLQALALYGWRELNDSEGMMAVQEALKTKDWIVLEAALSALGRLEKDKRKVEQLTLGIPTQYLLKQDFETLLEGKHARHH